MLLEVHGVLLRINYILLRASEPRGFMLAASEQVVIEPHLPV